MSDSLEAHGQNFSTSFQIKLGQQGTASADALTAEDGYTFDNFRIYNPGPDLSISEIVEPVINGCGLGVERISVMVKNSSDLEFNNVLMKYTIGTDTVSEMISSLAANDELLYGFDLPYDFSQSGIYHLTVWLEHAMDGNPNTDTLDASISSFIEIDSFPYREDFETGSGGWLASGKNHSFEMGIPSGEIISHAASGQQAWATNLAGAYNANETSYLTSPCFDLSAMTTPVLSFAHVYEIENNYDYLWVEYTEDGSNWIKLGSSGEGVNWYNDGGEEAWDDSDDMWHVTSIPIPTTAPRVQVRFVFTSDVGLQLEGTGIDAIHIHEQAPVYDGPATIDSAVVMGTGWTNFNIDGTRLASIHPNGQDLGVTTVEMYKFDGITRDDGTAYLADRNWTINSTNTPGSSVKLRLYMTHDEAIDLTNAFGCIDCAWSMDPFDLESFKYSGINEDSTVSNNTSGQNTFYDTAVLVFPYDNGYVIEFEIAGFSEFWITSPRVLRSDSTWYDLQAGSDDAEEFIVSGGTNPYGDTLRLNGSYKTGLRFPGINIPRGSFISDARLVLTASGYSDTTNIIIEGESTPYSSPFNTGNYNITGRPVTGSYSIWPGSDWLADTEYTSPQLRSIIQEIVDNNGWYPGFSLGIQLSGVGGASVHSYESNPLLAAQLYIAYDSVCVRDGRLYVDQTASGDESGMSWENAIRDLQSALDLAAHCDDIDEIWIAQGTYTPGISDRTLSFAIRPGLKLYGGFNGSETDIDQRQPMVHTTILSANIGETTTDSDNAYHVIRTSEGSDTARIDGFTISDGRAFGTGTLAKVGGGIISAGHLHLAGCVLQNCTAETGGGAIYHSGENMVFILSNCTLQGNSEPQLQVSESAEMIIQNTNSIEKDD